MTFDATLNPVVYEGGIPVFIDTEADSWNISKRSKVHDLINSAFCGNIENGHG